MIESDPWIVSKTSKLNNIGLSPKQVSEIYFEGTADYFVHAWVIKPRDFDPSKKKYPLCLQVHGGPNDSWDDEWNAWVSRPAGYDDRTSLMATVESISMG
jgi:dipeptidyl aminopeptidase/acylaminoacyl peptidase